MPKCNAATKRSGSISTAFSRCGSASAMWPRLIRRTPRLLRHSAFAGSSATALAKAVSALARSPLDLRHAKAVQDVDVIRRQRVGAHQRLGGVAMLAEVGLGHSEIAPGHQVFRIEPDGFGRGRPCLRVLIDGEARRRQIVPIERFAGFCRRRAPQQRDAIGGAIGARQQHALLVQRLDMIGEAREHLVERRVGIRERARLHGGDRLLHDIVGGRFELPTLSDFLPTLAAVRRSLRFIPSLPRSARVRRAARISASAPAESRKMRAPGCHLLAFPSASQDQ